MRYQILIAVLFLSLSAFAQHSIAVQWTAPTTGGAVTGYNVKRATTSGGPYTTLNTSAVSGTSFTDTSAAVQSEGTKFFLVVSATGPGGESPNSPEVSATIPFSLPGIPAAPTATAH